MQTTYIQTEDRSLVRDLHSKALLNTDRSALKRHRAIRLKAQEQESLSTRVEKLESRIEDIMQMQQEILALLRPHG